MDDSDLIDILRDVVIEVAGDPVPYEGITGAQARLFVARRKVTEALIKLATGSRETANDGT